MNSVVLSKISSIVKNLNLPHKVHISDEIISEMGSILVVKVVNAKTKYNILELQSGRMSALQQGDVIPVVLGNRSAMQGVYGIVPKNLLVGGNIDILNMGGVAGECIDYNPNVGDAVHCVVLGAIVDKNNKPLNLLNNAIVKHSDKIISKPKLIAVIGSGMNCGKTTVGSAVVQILSSQNKNISVAKVSGVGAMRDIYSMLDHGAKTGLSFVDAGLPSTCIDDKNLVINAAKGIINVLSELNPDGIFLEFGDGLYGDYGVKELLIDKEIRESISICVLCANDIPGAVKMYQDCLEIGVKPDIISGPVTDNAIGINAIKNLIGVEIFNAFRKNSIDVIVKILNIAV